MTDNLTIRWGFIGCGEVTEKKSGPAFSAVDGSKVVAVMSRNKEKARSYAIRHGIPKWYDDAQRLVDDPNVNAVYIATPPSTHATYAIMAMKSGKAVYIEKPMASNYEDCGRINRIAEKTNVPCFVAYYRRYLPYFLKVKEIIKSGRIGNPINIQIRFAVPPRDLDYNRDNLPWRVQPDIAGGGYFYDLAPHQIDLLQEMFGPIIEAEGYTANRGGLYKTEDTVSACFRFTDGTPGWGHGVSWHTKVRKKTASRLSATQDRSVFRCSPMPPSYFTQHRAVRNLPLKIPPAYSYRSSNSWLNICKTRPSARATASAPLP